MRKKRFLLLLALLALLTANLNLCYRVSVDGTWIDGCYTRTQLDSCRNLARETAEEILGDSVTVLPLKTRLTLRFSHPEADERLLTDALIRSVPGIRLCDGVIVNGTQLGTVADGEILMEKLRAAIRSEMPNAAVFGNISGKVQIRKIYALDGHDTPDEDMILLITGMAPVIYVDGSGKAV